MSGVGGESRLKSIFGEAIDRTGDDRRAFLDRECRNDAALRQQVESLLIAAEKADPFLGHATMESEIEGKPTEVIGSRIGPYRLLQLIGEGGFGSVYMAEQEEPVRRRVALKIIKLGMDTRSVVARFEQERQALALMDHPHIAKVLDAGATSVGRPYFVMELVKGEPITTFCDKNNLTIAERLDLFSQVCQAVQHAHTKGVIHRDLKPSNILVGMQDGRAQARVIDFGIAKATNHRMTEKTIFTEFRQLIGTPEYMSPEQAEGGLDIDTRTDVYSLGVLLYELLTGSTPFDPKQLRSAAYAEMQRIIREVDPPRPSTRIGQSVQTLTDVAARRRTEPSRLGTTVRGELDWIVMKALEKDRSRRYESAGQLVRDVHSYLTGQAVSAAPPSAAYRLRKFARRHRLSVATGGLVAAALVLGVVGTSIGLINAQSSLRRAVTAEGIANERTREAEVARDRALAAEKLSAERLTEAEKARAESDRFNKIATAVTEFFTLDVLDLHPTPAGEPELTVRQVLDRVPQKIKNNFKSEPAVEGVIRERVGQLYLNLGESSRAAEYLISAVPLLESGLGADSKTTLRARQRLGDLLVALGRYGEAESELDKVYQSRLRVLGPTHVFTMNSSVTRGAARVRAGKVEEGLREIGDGIAQARSQWGPTSRPTLMFERELIEADLFLHRGGDAETLARSALAKIRDNPAELGPAEADFRSLLGAALVVQQKFPDALPELDAAWELQRQQRGITQPVVLELRENRAKALEAVGKLADAAAELEGNYDALVPAFGASSDRCRALAGKLLDLATRLGDTAAAERWRARVR